MHRIGKLVGIILILGIVFFIICDEKGYKIGFEDNHIVFSEIEKKSDLSNEEIVDNQVKLQPTVVYKNSDLIRIASIIGNSEILRSSGGLDPEYLAKLEQEKIKLEEQRKRQVYTGPNIISLNKDSSISSVFQMGETNENVGNNLQDIEDINNNVEDEKIDKDKIEEKNVLENENMEEKVDIVDNEKDEGKFENEVNSKTVRNYFVKKYERKNLVLNLRTGIGVEIPIVETIENLSLPVLEIQKHSVDLKKGEQPEVILGSIEKYQLNRHVLQLKYGVFVENNFEIEVTNDEDINQNEGQLSDSMLSNLLENEEIGVEALESENDEFLQQVFEKTKDTYIMNLIVENYLSEYQFVKAKKFIESLSEIYYEELKPSLNLRVAFNSFALTSKTTNETLTSLIQGYKSKNQISKEDANWYLGVLALMQRNYDSFFTISSSFTLDSHKAFTSKLQGYREQISKQMGMPEYYFDTLVALELFNQGLFQPSKVLALYSLQQNSDYILPYQILAYANFLTNSWDTSIEYLKKLADLDKNNVEKYRFLMGVAYYRAEKYEQSVTMLSTIQNDKLRLDTQRYLINDYLQLDQKNKLIITRNKLLGYEDLVASDFYTYFYEVFYHPYSEGGQYQLYAFDTELTNKMLRVCSMKLSEEEKAVCTYGSIGRNIALGQFEGLEQYLLDLTSQYPQGYLYQALGEYYMQQGDDEKAKVYLLKAVSMINNKSEIFQIKNLLQGVM